MIRSLTIGFECEDGVVAVEVDSVASGDSAGAAAVAGAAADSACFIASSARFLLLPSNSANLNRGSTTVVTQAQLIAFWCLVVYIP